MSDMAFDFDFGGDSDEQHSWDSPSSASGGSDSSSDRSDLDLVAEISFPEYKPVKNTPKWTVGNRPAGVNYEDYETVISSVYHLYTQNKTLPSLQEITIHSSVAPTAVKQIMESREFIQAVQSRGVPWLGSNGLTTQQMLAIQVLTNPTDKRALKDKLRAVGVTYPVYRAWMRQPAFSQYMFKITEGMLTDHLPDFNTALTNKGLAGDLNAIRYINELSGRHDPNRQQVVDLVAIVERLLDIIQRNVTDPAMFQRIAAEFQMTVASKTTLQGEITREPHN